MENIYIAIGGVENICSADGKNDFIEGVGMNDGALSSLIGIPGDSDKATLQLLKCIFLSQQKICIMFDFWIMIVAPFCFLFQYTRKITKCKIIGTNGQENMWIFEYYIGI